MSMLHNTYLHASAVIPTLIELAWWNVQTVSLQYKTHFNVAAPRLAQHKAAHCRAWSLWRGRLQGCSGGGLPPGSAAAAPPHTKVMRERPWLTCHTLSSSYSSSASWNWAGVKPRVTQRCSASAIRTTPPAPPRPPWPSVASSLSREKMTSAGRCVLEEHRERGQR